MNYPMGLPSMLAPIGDSTNIDPRIWAILQKRKALQGSQPKVTVADDIKAINAGVKQPEPDSAKLKMAHQDWLAHIDKLGYELQPKKKSQ